MPRRPDVQCAGCGKLLWTGTGSLAAEARKCRDCRKTHSYWTGCRCDECRAKMAAKQRRYAASVKARTGRSIRALYPDGSDSHWISSKRRLAVYERDGWACWLCGGLVDREAHYNANSAPSLDHVVPRSKGGTHAEENLRCAHQICNRRRGASDVSKELAASAGGN